MNVPIHPRGWRGCQIVADDALRRVHPLLVGRFTLIHKKTPLRRFLVHKPKPCGTGYSRFAMKKGCVPYMVLGYYTSLWPRLKWVATSAVRHFRALSQFLKAIEVSPWVLCWIPACFYIQGRRTLEWELRLVGCGLYHVHCSGVGIPPIKSLRRLNYMTFSLNTCLLARVLNLEHGQRDRGNTNPWGCGEISLRHLTRTLDF